MLPPLGELSLDLLLKSSCILMVFLTEASPLVSPSCSAPYLESEFLGLFDKLLFLSASIYSKFFYRFSRDSSSIFPVDFSN